jgi:hypothetical protein
MKKNKINKFYIFTFYKKVRIHSVPIACVKGTLCDPSINEQSSFISVKKKILK